MPKWAYKSRAVRAAEPRPSCHLAPTLPQPYRGRGSRGRGGSQAQDGSQELWLQRKDRAWPIGTCLVRVFCLWGQCRVSVTASLGVSQKPRASATGGGRVFARLLWLVHAAGVTEADTSDVSHPGRGARLPATASPHPRAKSPLGTNEHREGGVS